MKKILFLSNHFITLYAFRKELIQKLIDDGHEVCLSLPDSEENRYFSDLGCKIIPTAIDRRGVNPLADLKLLAFYRKIIRDTDPDIIFSYTVKPNIYGTFVSNRTGHRQICNITGTGGLFLKKTPISRICMLLYRMSVRKCHKVFFQNTGDRDFFVRHKLVAGNYAMLPGSGCNLREHISRPMDCGSEVRFLFVGRVMKLKGIDTYLLCAKTVHAKYPHAKFYIAGWNEEPEYRQSIAAAEKRGEVVDLGFRKDIPQWLAKCHCVILPSLGGEGVPNVLLEAAATSRACIASRISGSMDVVDHGITGYLFDAGNAESLIAQVEKFLSLSWEQRIAMGLAGREKVEREYDRQRVIELYLKELNDLEQG